MENPKIRFKGFTKDWEQRKLIDYLEVSSEKNRDNRFTKEDVLSVSGEYGIVNQIEFQGRSFAGASVSNYGVVENGDVVYTKSPLKSNPYGIIKTNKGIPGIVSTLYAVYKPKEITDSKFVQIYFELDSRMNSYMHPLVNKGAKNDMKVSAENALKGMVSFPKKDEQEMISLYFSTLDNLITLHQRKCEQTKKLKKYMLQKMFPQNGAKVPEIRFYGFTYDWEQRKLGDVFEQTLNLVNPKEDEIELWSLTVEDGLTKKSDRYNREFLVKKDDNFKEVRPGDIVYNPMNMTLGAVGYNGMAKSVAVSGYYTTMVAKENYDTYYINTWLKSPQAIRLYRTYATGSLIEKQRVQFPTLSIIPVTFPKYEEQIKIGSYFHSIDNLITLHQRKCDELKKMKKYMLQNMFI